MMANLQSSLRHDPKWAEVRTWERGCLMEAMLPKYHPVNQYIVFTLTNQILPETRKSIEYPRVLVIQS